MRRRIFSVMGGAAVVLVAAGVLLKLTTVPVASQTRTAAAAKAGPAPKTAWGEPDLQGIWIDDYQTPLQRPPQYATKEFFTPEEQAEIDRQRAALQRREVRVERGTEKDVAGAYNAVFQSIKHTGRRTSMVVDPPDGRIPALTPQAQKAAAEDRQFRLTLLQATQTCKDKEAACAGGQYGPRSPRYNDLPPRYNSARMNRHDNPEDDSLGDRCMLGAMPDLAGYKRIVQTPGGITMYNDIGQGQGFQRNIVMNGTPHLPASIRQWWGDSRGHWEGNTLVVDVTNFNPKADFRGSRENLHLIERWTRLDANTLEYAVTIEDPTVWIKPWTVKQELTRQPEQANRIYYEPRCQEGNYGLPSLLLGTRSEELAFAEGRGPDPAAKDTATCFVGDAGEDPLAGQ
jgi:hypothetical protein